MYRTNIKNRKVVFESYTYFMRIFSKGRKKEKISRFFVAHGSSTLIRRIVFLIE